MKHIKVNEKVMWKGITLDAVNEGWLQDDPHSCARDAGPQPSLISVSFSSHLTYTFLGRL